VIHAAIVIHITPQTRSRAWTCGTCPSYVLGDRSTSCVSYGRKHYGSIAWVGRNLRTCGRAESQRGCAKASSFAVEGGGWRLGVSLTTKVGQW
jgi:hypothetical protein